jgi:hypothetical protein
LARALVFMCLFAIRMRSQSAAERGAKYMERDDKGGEQKRKRWNSMQSYQAGEQEADRGYKQQQMQQTEAK